jgi:hypothetical protein
MVRRELRRFGGGVVFVNVSSTVSDVVLDGSGDSDVGMGGGFGVDKGVFFDDCRDGGDVDAFGKRLELDRDGDVVACCESSGSSEEGRVKLELER